MAVTESEGEVGYIIQQALYNELAQCQISKPVVTKLTQVLVDPLDQAFNDPSKPIGPFYSAIEAAELQRQGISMAYFSNDGWPLVLASPRPLRIIEGSTIQRLVEIEAAIHFVKTCGHQAIITEPESLALALDGLEGTHIIP